MMMWRFSLQRLLAILIKELVQMRRDRLTFAMMLGVPIMQLILFGYAINSDSKQLPSALLPLGNGPYTRALVSAFETSGYYHFITSANSRKEADDLLAEGRVSFLLTIPSDFDTRMMRGDHPQILIEADASDPVAASNALGAVDGILASAFTSLTPTTTATLIANDAQPTAIIQRRYNPEGISQYNIVPGLLGVILQLTMVMMTAMALTRERERGTMENLLAMPATGGEIMLGKILPYMGVGAAQVVVVLVAAKLMFAVPFLGGLGLLLFAILLFVLALVLLGYTISTLSQTQMQAMQMTVFFFLPSLLLSGFMFPFFGMPAWAQTLGEFFPLTHFLRIIRAVMLKGAAFNHVDGEIGALCVFILAYAGLALARFRTTLD